MSKNSIGKADSFYSHFINLYGKNLQSVILALADEERAARIEFEDRMKEGNQLCKAAKISYKSEIVEFGVQAPAAQQKILLTAYFVFDDEKVLLYNATLGNFAEYFANLIMQALTKAFKDAELVFDDLARSELYHLGYSFFCSIAGIMMIPSPLISPAYKLLLLEAPALDECFGNILSVLYTEYIFSNLYVPEQDIIALYDESIEVMKNEKEKYEKWLNSEEGFCGEYEGNKAEKKIIKVVFDVQMLCNNLDGLFDENSVLAKELEEEFIKCGVFIKASFALNNYFPPCKKYGLINNSVLGVKYVTITALVETFDKKEAIRRINIYSFDIRNAFKKVLGAIILEYYF